MELEQRELIRYRPHEVKDKSLARFISKILLKDNVVFIVTLCSVPFPKSFAEDRLNAYVKAAQLAGVPLCMCEFNMKPYKQYPEADVEANQTLMDLFVDKFQEVNALGWAYWLWNFRPHTNPNFNLISVAKDESIQPTQNFDYIKNTGSTHKRQNDSGIVPGAATNESSNSLATSTSGLYPQPLSNIQRADEETIFPTVNISTVAIRKPGENSVLITGQAFDVGTDIKEVGVRVDDCRFEDAKPDNRVGWLRWTASVPIENLEEGDHEVVARTIDNANHTKRETVMFSVN